MKLPRWTQGPARECPPTISDRRSSSSRAGAHVSMRENLQISIAAGERFVACRRCAASSSCRRDVLYSLLRARGCTSSSVVWKQVRAVTFCQGQRPAPDVHVLDRGPCQLAVGDVHVLELKGELELVEELERSPRIPAEQTRPSQQTASTKSSPQPSEPPPTKEAQC